MLGPIDVGQIVAHQNSGKNHFVQTAKMATGQSDVDGTGNRYVAATVARSEVGRHCRPDDAARRRTFSENRNTRGADLGAGTVRGAFA